MRHLQSHGINHNDYVKESVDQKLIQKKLKARGLLAIPDIPFVIRDDEVPQAQVEADPLMVPSSEPEAESMDVPPVVTFSPSHPSSSGPDPPSSVQSPPPAAILDVAIDSDEFMDIQEDDYGRILYPSKSTEPPPLTLTTSPSPPNQPTLPLSPSSPSSPSLPTYPSSPTHPSNPSPSINTISSNHPSSNTSFTSISEQPSSSPVQSLRPSNSRQMYGEAQGKGHGKGGLSMRVNQKKLTLEYQKMDRASQLQEWHKYKEEYTKEINNILKKNRSASELQCVDCTKFISTKNYLKHRTKGCKNLDVNLTFYKFRQNKYGQ